MVIQELTAEECREMLAGRNLVRLACARNGQPYVVPIQVDLDGDYLYGYTTLGQKIEWMRENPLVCLEIDAITSNVQWETVVVFGRYEELPPSPDYAAERAVADRLFQKHPMWWEPATVPPVAHQLRTPVVFRIRITGLTGRCAGTKPAPTS
jgi:nitroimidazol reductase NimA-like FMN-containing flavoprotein (pyridoxamine 5'-phosphate oxidase superfamily)